MVKIDASRDAGEFALSHMTGARQSAPAGSGWLEGLFLTETDNTPIFTWQEKRLRPEVLNSLQDFAKPAGTSVIAGSQFTRNVSLKARLGVLALVINVGALLYIALDTLHVI
jgi:hypothetical protein